MNLVLKTARQRDDALPALVLLEELSRVFPLSPLFFSFYSFFIFVPPAPEKSPPTLQRTVSVGVAIVARPLLVFESGEIAPCAPRRP